MADRTGMWTGLRGRRRRTTLRVLADSWVPSLAPPPGAPSGHEDFWRRTASDLGVPEAVAGYIDDRLPEADREGLRRLLDLAGLVEWRLLPQGARERLLAAAGRANRDVARGLDALRAMTLMFFYGDPGPDGVNPNWATLGYPGPAWAEPPADRLPVTRPASGAGAVELAADVVVVGSGAGGGVIAGVLARAGLDVVVLDMGGDRQEADFLPYELAAYRDVYWRGGYQPTAEESVSIIAGSTLGGGTTVNWMNCVRPPDAVRERWAELGLKGLDGDDFEGHLRAVLERIGATDRLSDRNGPNARLAEAADAMGWSWKSAARNADPERYSPDTAGHMGFGDRSGSKLGTLRTYLRDAVDAGARVVPEARARRVLTGDGRATGVEGTVRRADGTEAELRVRAGTVVAACGALETPALLLRSGIGGPAVGRYLRLHPVDALTARYPDEQRAWWGPPQAVIVDEFGDLTDGFGFLLETPHFGTGLAAVSLPWAGGRDHKAIIAGSAHIGSFIGLVRDRGAGRVTIDDAGEAVVSYPLDDALDLAHLRRALDAMARAHAAAGAVEIFDLSPGAPRWRSGDDLDAFVERILAIPMGRGAGGRGLFSAHQMGSARMGTDRAGSVADPEGQLHDTPGVWVGDTSAFPTSVGSNPMVTCMALARRTAHAILAARAGG